MKKIFSLLLLLPMLAFVSTSCSDDKDRPDVDITISYSGASTDENGVITVAQGTDLVIDAINVTPADGTKKAMLGNTVYYVDGEPVYTIGVAPFGGTLNTSDLSLGTHRMAFMSQVFQVDREPGFALYGFDFVVTEQAAGGSGTITPEVKVSDAE